MLPVTACAPSEALMLPSTARRSRVVVDDLGVGLVEAGREVRLGRGEADGVADALAERA